MPLPLHSALTDSTKSLTLHYSIIAVHGLAAHPIKTWVQKKEEWNWLEQQLVNIIPRAQVWTFGYNSDWCGDSSVITKLYDVAGKLLDAIKHEVLIPEGIALDT